MTALRLRQWSLLGLSAVLLSGCAIADGLTDSEKEMVADMAPSKYQPATRDLRNSIETQDNFAQAAFWSQQYRLNPADLEAAIKLSAAVRKIGNPGKAVEIAQTTRAMYPKDPYLTAEFAAALLASERTGDAITAADEGLRVAPGYARLWSLKGAALDQQEQYELARKHYGRALQITPDDPNVMSNLGLSYALAGDPQTAETWLRRAAQQPGAGEGIRQNLALVMQLQGKQPAQTQSIPPQPQNGYSGEYRNAPQPYQSYAAPQTQPQGYPSNAPAYSQQSQQPQKQYQSYQPQAQQFESRPSQARQPQYRQPLQMNRQASQSPQMSSSSAPQTLPQYGKPTAPTAPNGNFGYSSSFTVVGQQEGGPQSAADAARAAAAHSQGQNRKVVVPLGQSPTAPAQTDILSQIAQNVGPRPAGQPQQSYSSYADPQYQYPTPAQSQPTPQPSIDNNASERRGAARRR